MNGKVTLYDNDKETKNGYPVKVILSHNRVVRRKTIHYSTLDYWNTKKDVPNAFHPDYNNLYDTIVNIRKECQKEEFRALDDFNTAFAYLIKDKEKNITDFIVYGRNLADEIEPRSKGNASAYRYALKELEKFQHRVFFKDLSTVFFERFKRHKKVQGLKNTSIRAYLYAYKAMYEDAVKLGVIENTKPFEGIFKDIPVRKRRAKDHYLNEEMLLKLEDAKFSQHNYNIAKDLVLLQFYLGGLDFVDLIHIKRNQLNNGRLFIYRKKRDEQAYEFDVKIFDKARLLMEKYEGEDKEYYFYFPVTYVYETWRVRMYRALQQVKKKLEIELLPRDSTFTLKVMRHTFATLGKFKRVPEDMLREMQGHERQDIDTIYKSKFLEHERDEAQKSIIYYK